jgi:O-acetyl-ADP-ribose deacetylase (regulator of RNase III)
VWHGGNQGEPELLAACYRRCLEIASEHGITTLAFPSIGTGAFGYPIEAAARVAVDTVRSTVADTGGIGEVIFCCFSERDLAVYGGFLRSIHDASQRR